MQRRFKNLTRDKLLNTAALAPVMPTPRKKRAVSIPAPVPATEQKEPPQDLYGVPVAAARLIAINAMFWILGFAIVMSRVLDVLHFLMALFVMVAGLMIWFGLHWLISRAFWWFVVIYSSAISIALIVLFVSRVLDAMERVPSIQSR